MDHFSWVGNFSMGRGPFFFTVLGAGVRVTLVKNGRSEEDWQGGLTALLIALGGARLYALFFGHRMIRPEIRRDEIGCWFEYAFVHFGNRLRLVPGNRFRLLFNGETPLLSHGFRGGVRGILVFFRHRIRT